MATCGNLLLGVSNMATLHHTWSNRLLPKLLHVRRALDSPCFPVKIVVMFSCTVWNVK